MINSLDSDENSNDKFQSDGRQYIIDTNDIIHMLVLQLLTLNTYNLGLEKLK